MKFQIAVALLLSAVGAESRPSYVGMKNIPADAFTNIPSLAAQDREHRAQLDRRLKQAALKQSGTRKTEQDWGQYTQYWDDEMVVEQFGFDIHKYSVKYTGCKVVKGWDDAVAENQNFDTVLGAETFVTFRLCPTATCDAQYPYGCTSNYGEYMLKLDEYVEAQTAYRESKKTSFCNYCEVCAAMKGYANWNTMMTGSVQNLATKMLTVFEEFKASYTGQDQNGGNYDANAAGSYTDAKLKMAYNKAAKNAVTQGAANQASSYNGDNMYGAYGNNYGNNGQAASSAAYTSFVDMQAVFGYTKQYWLFTNSFSNRDNSNLQSAAWLNLNSQFPTFCGKPVFMGYFDNQGDFNEEIGYFNDKGNYIPFDGTPMVWDQSCMGEIPYAWDIVQGNDPDEFEECDATYATSCQNAYQECQFTLHYDDMEEKYQDLLSKSTNSDQSNTIAYQLKQFEASFLEQTTEQKYTNALSCQQIEHTSSTGDDDDMEESLFANQLNFEDLNAMKEQYYYALDACKDEGCQYAVQESMRMNSNYQSWVIKSAWAEYKRYKALNSVTYIGAYCGKDGFEIGLKVFSDEYCSVENDLLSVKDVLGEDLDMTYDLVSGECIPCNNDQFAIEIPGDEDEDTVDGVLPFCSMLYQLAAKCNKKLTPDRVYQAGGYYLDGVYHSASFSLMYGSEQQQVNEKKICAMVDSLNSGTYLEDGSIVLGGTGWMTSEHWKSEFASASTGMPKATKSLIFVLMVLCAAMGLWSMVLQGALRRKSTPWYPKQGPMDLARQESGIVMGRSRSAPANTPLI